MMDHLINTTILIVTAILITMIIIIDILIENNYTNKNNTNNNSNSNSNRVDVAAMVISSGHELEVRYLPLKLGRSRIQLRL